MRVASAKPFQANCCLMPTAAAPRDAGIYNRLRDRLLAAHCGDGRPAHKCAGQITLTRDSITMQCPRCGDIKQLLGPAL